jgi:small-conductance mechanosensitive channel
VQTTLWTIVAAVGAAALALGVVHLMHRIVVRLGRRSPLWAELAHHVHRPTQLVLTLVAVQIAVRHGPATGDWQSSVRHILWLTVIGACAWFVAALVLVLEDVALVRFRTDVPDNKHARRVHTQVVMLRRITVAIVVLLALGVMLTTFPQVRAIGASMLASAGLAGVVAALAAQSVLGNVFAGLQLAFSDAVRLDDVVVVEGEWGRVEELTLTYVVVQLWDDRRLILPPSYFTTKPFQNWTRSRAAVLGTVEIDVDWSVPVPQLRDELRRCMEASEQWDGRVSVLQVTDAIGGLVRLRALVSAVDAPTLWDLRCVVRENLVAWVRDRYPTALPRMRAEVSNGPDQNGWRWVPAPRRADPPATPQPPVAQPAPAPAWAGAPGRDPGSDADAHVFSGGRDAEARGHTFVGPEDQTDRQA